MQGAFRRITGGVASLYHRLPCWDASGIRLDALRPSAMTSARGDLRPLLERWQTEWF